MDPLLDFGPLPGPPPPPVVLDAASGTHVLAPPTVDSDADGVPDTAVLVVGGPGPDGARADTLVLATDLDADHRADVVTTVDTAGSAHTVEAGPDGRFVTDPTLPADTWSTGPDPDRDAGWSTPAPPAPSIDPATGAWTRRPG